MRKDKLFKAQWISFKDRQPPDDEEVLIWIPEAGAKISPGQVVNAQRQLRKDKGKPGFEAFFSSPNLMKEMKRSGHFATHWMRIYKPEK